MAEYEKTPLTFFATMHKPQKSSKVKATCVVPIERLKEAMSEGFAACEEAGKTMILLKIIDTDGKGKGDFWLAGEPPTDRKGGSKADKPKSDW